MISDQRIAFTALSSEADASLDKGFAAAAAGSRPLERVAAGERADRVDCRVASVDPDQAAVTRRRS